MTKKKLHRPLFNAAAFLWGLYIICSNFNYSVYFYRQHQYQAILALLLLLFLLGVWALNRKDKTFWTGWWKSDPGAAFFTAVVILMPIGLFLLQWNSTFKDKETTIGIIVEKRPFRIFRFRGLSYRGLLMGVRRASGEVRRFDVLWYKNEYDATKLGQTISIKHYPWIRDKFLEFRLE